ncbi:MAG TPA: DUF4912 domain-containing protein [Trichocoleus sp.]
MTDPALAQSAATQTSFPPPDSVPSGSTLRISSSDSMSATNQALKQKFEAQYSGTAVETAMGSSDEALKAVLDGKADLAAIGRALTEAEKSQGLVGVPISREKIAIIVSSDSLFQSNLSFEQFARIFRGEITNWSQVGGAAGKIRFVDRPETSDTRQALSQYQVFRSAPFQAGKTATPVAEDKAAAVITNLGQDGISYAVANQVTTQPNVRILSMHGTLPTNPAYPYSQPRNYVYKQMTSPVAQGFLGFVAAPIGQETIAQADTLGTATAPSVLLATNAASSSSTDSASGAIATTGSSPAATESPIATASPDATAPTTAATNDPNQAGWLPWLLLPLLLGGLFLWWRRRSTAAEPLPGQPVSPSAPSETLPPASSTLAARAGSVISADRLETMNERPVETVEQNPELPEGSPERLAATSSTTTPPISDPWVETAETTDLPDTTLLDTALPDTTLPDTTLPDNDASPLEGAAFVAAAGVPVAETDRSSPPIEAPTAETPVVEIPAVEAPITETPVTETPIESSTPSPEVFTTETPATPELTTPDSNLAESIASTPDHTPTAAEAAPEVDGILSAGEAALIAGAAALVAAQPDMAHADDSQSTIAAAKFNVGQSDLSSEELATVDLELPSLPSGYGETHIVLLPRDPQWAYAYWDAPGEHREALRRAGGRRLALRFYDITDIDLARQNPHSLQQYDCDEMTRDWYIPVPISDRDYIAEIGYVTEDGGWLMLARSLPIHIPPVYPTDWYEEQFTTIDWQEDLHDKTVLELTPPGKRKTFDNPIYDRIFGLNEAAEAQRVAGSLFGSMHQVSQTISSFASGAGIVERTESGVGMSGIGMTIPTLSGAGMMSGIGILAYTESGIGMSGIGMGIPTLSGIGMVSGVGMGIAGMSGVGMSGMGIPTLSGIGMMSGVGMSGIGMGVPTLSGVGMMSGIGMYSTSGIGMYTTSGVGMYSTSGVGMYTLSGMGMSGVGFSASMPPIRPRKFWLIADAELIVYGATEPDAIVTIAGQPVQLAPDGTFRFQMSFQDGLIDYPIMATAADGEQNRAIHMKFVRETPSRNTNTKEEATDEWPN